MTVLSGSSASKTRELSALTIVLLLAAARLIFHLVTNSNYGFHRDELAVVDDARRLAWGYVAYPPFTPFIARIAFEIFGTSLAGLRLFSSLAQCIAMVVAALMVREMGGGRFAQILSAIATAIAPMSLVMSAMFQYIAFDFLWWVLVAYLIVRIIRTGEAKLWVAVGLVIGLGMLTKYTMAFLALSVATAVLLSPLRRFLRSGWLWLGVAVSLLVFLPNLIWQVQHDFISLRFLSSIQERDVDIGRTDGFLSMQLFVSANPFTLPIWLAGLWHVLVSKHGRPWRPVGFLYLFALMLFLVAEGRFYYLAPAYPMLFAAGSLRMEMWLGGMPERRVLFMKGMTAVLMIAGTLFGSVLMLPLAPINSPLWNFRSGIHDNFSEQIGWQELTHTVATIHRSLPPPKVPTAVLTGNYGEAGAINLYGPALDLPQAISGINSYWYLGYGPVAPQRVIILGYSPADATRIFHDCRMAGEITNRFGVENEETRFHREIFVCGEPKIPWSELWPRLQSFG